MRIAVLLVLFALLAAGCADGDDDQSLSQPGNATAVEPALAPASATSSQEVGPETVPFILLDYASQPSSAIQVTADGGLPPEAPDTLLFRKVETTYYPLLAPDGHQLNSAEWATAAGTATIKCEQGGTRYDLKFSGLVPEGVYTIWHFPTTEPITSRLPSGQIEDPIASGKAPGGGPLGTANGDENAFTADGEGAATLNVLAAARGQIPECTLISGVVLVLLYHIDSQTWGSEPGPDETGAGHGVFNYPSLEGADDVDEQTAEDVLAD